MNALRRLLGSFHINSYGKWILLSLIVGVVAGIGAIVFDVLGQIVVLGSLNRFAGYAPPEAAGEVVRFEYVAGTLDPLRLVIVMALGGLLSGILVYTFAPEAEGHGTDAAIDAFHNKRGEIRARIPFIKTLASAITLGTGGSGGREGPIAQIGAGFGSWLGTAMNLSHRERRIMLAAGMGAGIGAIFRAPLAGALFAGEILYSEADLEADVIVPAAASSVIAYSVYTQTLPPESRFIPLFGSQLEHTFASPAELIPYTILAVALTFVGYLYVKTFYGIQELFHRLPIIPHIRPAIGAALAGIVGCGLLFAFHQDTRILGVLGTGYGTLQQALTASSELGIAMLLAIALGKILTTSLTISSGGSGGVFGPSMVIGGCTGTAVGLAMHASWPELVSEPEAFGVVGMAGFFAGVARAPISTILMVRALTGDYGLVIPTMLVSTLTFVMCHRWRLYRNQVPNRMESPAHRGDFIIDVLEDVRVGDIFNPDREIVLIPEGTSLKEIVHGLPLNHQHYFPVVDDHKRLVGIFSDNDVRGYLYDDTLWELAVARDIMTSPFLYVTPEDNLNTALKRFTLLNLDELPVVDSEDTGHLLGMLSRRETIAAYNQRLMNLKHGTESDRS